MGMKSLEEYRIDIVDVIKRQLAAAIRAKGGTVNDTDPFSAFVSAVANMTNKRWASGTVTSSSIQSFQYAGFATGTTMNCVTVTGLTFKPSLVILFGGSSFKAISIYSEIHDSFYPKTVKVFDFDAGSVSTTTYNFKGDVSPASVTSTGFTLPVRGSSVTYTWLAFE